MGTVHEDLNKFVLLIAVRPRL